jgi:hypothetical protein
MVPGKLFLLSEGKLKHHSPHPVTHTCRKDTLRPEKHEKGKTTDYADYADFFIFSLQSV